MHNKKMRHSKFKNTGILFELLTRQITADIIAGNDESEAKSLLFKYFKENTELGREWQLYNFLINEKITSDSHAERFYSVVLEQRKKLNNKKLLEEKYNLIGEIKNKYPIDEFLKSGIKNYRILASIYKLFEDASSKTEKFDVKEVYQAKNCIIENITNKRKDTDTDKLIKFYEKESQEIRLLSYKLLVESLNKKYTNLDDNQKMILREYINNVSNTNSLGKFISIKINNVKEELIVAASKIKDSDVVRIKINEVVKQLDKVSPGKIVKDNQIMVVLLSYELLKEINNKLNERPASTKTL
jgi:hypothetical protein